MFGFFLNLFEEAKRIKWLKGKILMHNIFVVFLVLFFFTLAVYFEGLLVSYIFKCLRIKG